MYFQHQTFLRLLRSQTVYTIVGRRWISEYQYFSEFKEIYGIVCLKKKMQIGPSICSIRSKIYCFVYILRTHTERHVTFLR